MLYRFEARFSPDARWSGICAVMNPSERRKVARFLHEPKWYKDHPGVETEAWFTELGYARYKEKIETIIAEMWMYRSADTMDKFECRIRTVPESSVTIVSKGKVQCNALPL